MVSYLLLAVLKLFGGEIGEESKGMVAVGFGV
jgi:hypothetical protein